MNHRWPFAFCAFMIVLSCCTWAQEEGQTKGKTRAGGDVFTPSDPTLPDDASNPAELAAIRETETSFKKAFDAGDAHAVAAHWTADGELIDESGRRVQGRDAIEKEYAAFFAANPGIRIDSHIDRLRLVNAEAAIEDGSAAVDPAPAGVPGKSRYTAVHVKQDGKWLMSSVHEMRIGPPSRNSHLDDLDALIGTWVAENQGAEFQMSFRWIANGSFLEQTFESRRSEDVLSSGTQIVGWDPGNQTVVSWTFTSDGGHAQGIWTPHDTGWIVEATGVMNDGTPTSAVNVLTGLDENGIAWRSVNRTAGEFRVLDTEEVILRRKPAAQE